MDIAITAFVIVFALVLFATEWLPVGYTAMLSAVALMVTGVVTGEQVLGGISNQATVTVGAMFVVSAAFVHTGAGTYMSTAISWLFGHGRLLGVAAVCLAAAVLSAFVNNTTIVAFSLPLLVASSERTGMSVSRLLMPVSFASMLGGVCTLVGTSTNLVVSSVAEDNGLAPITMFELAPVGIVLLVPGLLYVVLCRKILAPRRQTGDQNEEEELSKYVTDIAITEPVAAEAETVADASIFEGIDCEIIAGWRNGEMMPGIPQGNWKVKQGDIFRVRCSLGDIPRLLEREVRVGSSASTDSGKGQSIDSKGITFVEAVVGPQSRVIGRRIEDVGFRENYSAVVTALRQRGRFVESCLSGVKLQAGDVLVLGVETESLKELEGQTGLILLGEAFVQTIHPLRMAVALGTLIALVTAAATGMLSIGAAALSGAVIVLATRCLRIDQAVEAVDWNVIMLLAGVLAIGHAMENSGLAAILAESFVQVVHGASIQVIIGSLYLMTALLTSFLSNNATAALLTPPAIVMASEMSMDPRPLVMAVAFGASTAFLTPVGYQTNAMIYGAGRYRFTDYAKFGSLLLAILTILVAIFIPIVWPP